KVRKQTPKVPKKERPRKLIVGRAKKRRQYQKKYAVLIPTADPQARKKFKPNKQQVK
ncbi:MAG: 30S ribosomal protein S30e, partial [Flammeovirgaceae bacterium]